MYKISLPTLTLTIIKQLLTRLIPKPIIQPRLYTYKPLYFISQYIHI